MHKDDKTHFDLLKQQIVATMQQSYPGINPKIPEWKGQEITDFQEDLLIKTKGNVSEKWFYNHIKADFKSLPRIDVLNILSKYVGCANWDEFVYKSSKKGITLNGLNKPNRYFVVVPVMVLVILGLLYLIFKLFDTRETRLIFYDSYTKEAIVNSRIEVKLLSDEESPVSFFSDSSGLLVLKTNQSKVRLVADAPYYHTDTITRIIRMLERDQKIELIPNDYALMIKYFSEMDVDKWKQRRKQLNNIFDEDALIYQVYQDANGKGMALYNKQEFIDKLTIPAHSLKNLEVLETRIKEDKIVVMRFRVNDKER